MKKIFSLHTALAALALVSGVMIQTSRADLIYDNSQNWTGNNFDIGTNEVGDQITFDGSARNLTNFTFQFWADNMAAGATVQIRFYLNDGVGGTPLTQIWQNTYTFGSGLTTSGATLSYDNSLLNDLYVAANGLTWTAQFSDLGEGGTAGVAIYTPPVIGGNFSDYWENDNGTWLLKTNAIGSMDFGATVGAVPEPSTFALCALGAAGLVALRRRR
jgi:hypothetical protein